MRKTLSIIAALGFLSACADTTPVTAFTSDIYEVYGVEEGDMLKLRGGPGTGFETRVGLPNGTLVRVRDCNRVGGTRWCDVALDRAPGLTGYASETYLRPKR